MDKFENITSSGNEKAIRRGKRVPDGDINLAWVKSPRFSPQNSMVILDTSNLTVENSGAQTYNSKFYYANHLGILQDEFGNEVFLDEFPAIADEFSIEENYDISDNNEFSTAHILAYKHVSRYFHIDQEDLVKDNSPLTLYRENIIVEDENGNEYIDSSGKKKYKTKLVKADQYVDSEDRTIGVYRVWIFVDTDTNENLYLKYNKVELDAGGKYIRNQRINYREILNPQPYFSYIPEETDVTDLSSVDKKIYSTKSTSQKEQIIGVPRASSDGYKVYVPRKAIQDPRLFQAFRWRIKTDFQERYTIDPENQPRVIRAGVLTTNPSYPRSLSDLEGQGSGVSYNYLQPPTNFPYVFYNLEKSDYNPSGAKIVNPLSEERGYSVVEEIDPAVQSPSDGDAAYNSPGYTWGGNVTTPLKRVSGEEAKEYAGYWLVNFDTVTDEELRKFDILFLDPSQFPSDLSPYIGKMHRFAKDFGGSIYIPVGGFENKTGLGITTTLPVHPYTAAYGSSTFAPGINDGDRSFGLGDTIAPRTTSDQLFNGLKQYGGWDFDSTAYSSVSPYKFHPSVLYTKSKSYLQFINSAEDTATSDGLEYWKVLFEVTESTGRPGVISLQVITKYPVTLVKRFASGGSIVYDTQNIIAECAKLEDSINTAPRRLQIPNYFNQINAGRFEGSYKFAWNLILSTIKSRPLDSSDETNYVSSWSFETDWKPSWAINGIVLKDVEKNKYSFNYEAKDATTPNQFTWRRKLAYGLSSSNYPIFKTIKEIVDEQIVKEMGREFLLKVSGSPRNYSIEVTNANVKVPTTLSDGMYPYAWTEEYSPDFIIPEGFGPHIIKEDPIMAEYSAGQYIDKSYPANKFAVKVKANYRDTDQSVRRETTTVLARYRGKEILPNGFIYSHVFQPRSWTEHGSNQVLFNRFNRSWGAPRPNSIISRNELFLSKTTAYPFSGISGSYSVGSSGEVVRFIQYALNKLHEIITAHLNRGPSGPIPAGMTASEGYTVASQWALKYRLPSGPLDQSGSFDQRTAEAVQALKTLAGSRYVDGIADSDFFSILGSQIQFWGLTTDTNQNTRTPGAFDTSEYNYLRYSGYVNRYMNLRNVSDSSVLYNYLELSDSRRNNIDRISDVFLIQYPKVYNFEYVSITPYLLGQSSSVNIDFVDIRKTRVDTTRFTGDMLNKAWQYFEIEERKGGGSGWVPDSPRVLWGLSPEYWGMNNNIQTTWDYRFWGGITKTSVSYAGDGLPFVGVEKQKSYIRMIQRALQVYPDGVFGSLTAAAARRWKVARASKWGIPVDDNWGLITSVPNIQKLLGITQDGFYGPETERAVMNWQANWGGAMPVDGFWGPITQKFTDELFIFLGGTPTVERVQKHLPQPFFVWPEDLLKSYNSGNALIPRLNKNAPNGVRTEVQIPQDSRSIGNTIIVGVSSTQTAGQDYNNQIQLGISDITGYGRDYVGFKTITGVPAVIDYEGFIRKTFDVYGDLGPIQLNHNYSETGAPGKLTDVEWGVDPISEVSTTIFPGFDPSSVGLYRVESSNPNVEAFITKQGKLYLRTDEVINNNTSKYTESNWLPVAPDAPLNGEIVAFSSRTNTSTSTVNVSNNPLYAMNENGRVFPGIETGFISKADGIKLLCTSDGKPVGIPVMPTGIGANEYQKHYVDIEIESYATSPFVTIGFYDKSQKEFIINKDGTSRLTYIEYVKRGPQNIYIGVVSRAEVVEKKNLPQVLDGLNELPFKYAMPVYGAVVKSKSKIGIDSIDANLDATDIWGVPIRVGSFNKNVTVPNYSSLPVGGWLSEYQGGTVQAFYSVPEADNMSWSSIFGRPYVDIKDEHPGVLDEDIIQVKHTPIFMASEPTQIPSPSDPQRPVLRVWTRDSTQDPWVELSKSDILDFNTSNGVIYLRDRLVSRDANLVKVNYTTKNRTYTVKTVNNQKVNLNPYLKMRPDLIGVPIYVYLLPEYVKNQDGEIIPESINSSTVYVTADNSVLSPYNPLYNPLAVQLGVVFVSASAKIDDLVVLDTRRRGGGALDAISPAEVFEKNVEAKSYWDVGYGAGNSFQAGGFVVIRLPKMLKMIFPDTKEIERIIRRNISAGVEFILEDLEGRPWDE